MLDPTITASLAARFPLRLVEQLVECYSEQKRNFYLGRMRPNEVEGGRFAEAAFRMLQHAAGFPVTPIGTQVDTESLIKSLANLPAASASESVRLHIPRTLRVIYDIRNKRDAAHLADGIDPNLQDSSLVSGAIDWILAEFVRLAGGLPADEAFALVRAITVKKIPAVEQFGDFLKTLRPSLGPSDRTLLLLYHCAHSGATASELSNWLKPKQRTNLNRTLSQLEHGKDFIIFVGGKYQITRRGIANVEARNLMDVE